MQGHDICFGPLFLYGRSWRYIDLFLISLLKRPNCLNLKKTSFGENCLKMVFHNLLILAVVRSKKSELNTHLWVIFCTNSQLFWQGWILRLVAWSLLVKSSLYLELFDGLSMFLGYHEEKTQQKTPIKNECFITQFSESNSTLQNWVVEKSF